MSRVRVLVLGGSGVFGRRLAARLAAEPDLAVLLASRSAARAARCCAAIRRERPEAAVEPVALTLPDGLEAVLEERRPDLVVDASGPFQGRPLTVPELCIRHGVHYLDLADARDFVQRFAGLDAAARAAGVIAITGASSVPGLSSVVVAALARGLARLDRVEIAILPGQRQPRGRAMIAGVLDTVGKPIEVLRDGARRRVHGWQDLRRLGPGDPLFEALGPRWLGACDVPDLELLPAIYPDLRDVRFHAGLEAAPAHLGLWALSWPVRWGWLPGLAPLAGGLGALARAFSPLGGGRGGMQVKVSGITADGRVRHRGWRLVAEHGQGIWVPVLPALLVARGIARAIARGGDPDTGARACINAFSLPDFARAIGPLAIGTATIGCDASGDGESLGRAA